MQQCTKCGVLKTPDDFYMRDYGKRRHQQCKECIKARVNKSASENRAATRERNRVAGRKFRQQNAETERVRTLQAYYDNKEKYSATYRAWAAANRPKRNANEARRRAQQLLATPAWADQERIAEFYKEAEMESARLGTPVHVDHIVPLKSRLVCGLHCEANLQLMVGVENISKSNRHWPDM